MTGSEIEITEGNSLALRVATETGFTSTQLELIRNSAAKGCSEDEVAQLLIMARRTGLDPLARQIYMIKRWDAQARREVATPQTGIDGYRLTADRTGRYAPGREPSFAYDDAGNLWSATAYVKKLSGGMWHETAATALYREYVQTKKDGDPTATWAKMPHVMLSKCFDEETEVLTDQGFQRFAEMTGRVLMVTESGLEATDAKPFAQSYTGPMVSLFSDDLNFCVTPNHDLYTTAGKIEAGEVYEQARARPKFWIPRCVQSSKTGVAMSDEQVELAAMYLADGTTGMSKKFRIEVSRPYKVLRLQENGLFQREYVREVSGAVAVTPARNITTTVDKQGFEYEYALIAPLCSAGAGKEVDTSVLLEMSRKQARIFVDTLVDFDGHEQAKTGVRRFYTSRISHLRAFETAAVIAGYSISPRRERTSDISSKPNYYVTISERNEIPLIRWGREYNNLSKDNERERTGLLLTPNTSGQVWCVTVPSGLIVVRRHGFSMICGNCAEALALRRAFPAELSGVYTAEEMSQADNDAQGQGAAVVIERVPDVAPTKCGCGALIQDHTYEDGRVMSAAKIEEGTRAAYGRALCWDCAQEAKAAKAEADKAAQEPKEEPKEEPLRLELKKINTEPAQAQGSTAAYAKALTSARTRYNIVAAYATSLGMRAPEHKASHTASQLEEMIRSLSAEIIDAINAVALMDESLPTDAIPGDKAELEDWWAFATAYDLVESIREEVAGLEKSEDLEEEAAY